jgi:hypothetical protein
VEAARMNGGMMNLIIGLIVGAALAWLFHTVTG